MDIPATGVSFFSTRKQEGYTPFLHHPVRGLHPLDPCYYGAKRAELASAGEVGLKSTECIIVGTNSL